MRRALLRGLVLLGGSVAGTAVAWAVATAPASAEDISDTRRAANEATLPTASVPLGRAMLSDGVSARPLPGDLATHLREPRSVAGLARCADEPEACVESAPAVPMDAVPADAALIDVSGLAPALTPGPLAGTGGAESADPTDTSDVGTAAHPAAAGGPGRAVTSRPRSPRQDPEVVSSAAQGPARSWPGAMSAARTTSRTDDTPHDAGDASPHVPAPVSTAALVTPAGAIVGSSGALLPQDLSSARAGADELVAVVSRDGVRVPVSSGSQPGTAPD